MALTSKQYYERSKAKDPAGFAAKHRALQARRRKEQPDVCKSIALKGKYGITLADFYEMLAGQGGVCAICKRPETVKRHGKVRQLAIDHDHDTGHIRGLLCSWCNLALGYLRDNPTTAQLAAEYLRTTKRG